MGKGAMALHACRKNGVRRDCFVERTVFGVSCRRLLIGPQMHRRSSRALVAAARWGGRRYSNMLVGGQGITSFAATKIKKVRPSIGGVLRTSSTERDRTRGRSAVPTGGVNRRYPSSEAVGWKIVAGLEGSSASIPGSLST